MTILIAAVIGILGGLHSACWGAYKDSPHEGFVWTKFLRSIVLGLVSGLVLLYLRQLVGAPVSSPALYLALVIACERFATEMYKAFVRVEPQEKYRIPSTLHLRGRPVTLLPLRIGIGILVVASMLLLFNFAARVATEIGSPLVRGFVVGSIAGITVAAGGVWKDAPIEGFRLLTFFRSPLAAVMWGAVFGALTSDVQLVLAASIGAERMSVELYKGFLRRRAPGKFDSTTVRYPEWLTARAAIVPPYALTWIAFYLFLFPDEALARDLGVVAAITSVLALHLWRGAQRIQRTRMAVLR